MGAFSFFRNRRMLKRDKNTKQENSSLLVSVKEIREKSEVVCTTIHTPTKVASKGNYTP